MKAVTLFLLATLTAASLSAGTKLPYDTPPAAVRTVPAEKPATASAKDYVAVLVTVKTDGSVAEAKVLKSTSPELESVAREAVLQYKFTPAQKDGKPVEANIVTTVRFS